MSKNKIVLYILILFIQYSLFSEQINSTGYYYFSNGNDTLHSLVENVNPSDNLVKIVKDSGTQEFSIYSHFSDNVFTYDMINNKYRFSKSDSTNNSTFRFIQIDNNTCYIQDKLSNLFLTISKNNDRKIITLDKFIGEDEQLWDYSRIGVSPMYVYTLRNITYNKFFDVKGVFFKNNVNLYPTNSFKSNLQLYELDGGVDQYLTLQNAGKNMFYIQPNHSPLLWNSKDSTVYLDDAHQSDSLKFEFIPASINNPNRYYLRNSSEYYIGYNGSRLVATTNKQLWELDPYSIWRLDPEEDFRDKVFYVKAAYSDKYWDLPRIDEDVKKVLKANKHPPLQMYKETWKERGDHDDRKYSIIPSGDQSWVFIEMQTEIDGKKFYLNHKSSSREGDKLYYKKGAPTVTENDCKFAIQFTSKNTFVIRTYKWLALDISGTDSSWKDNSKHITLQRVNFSQRQQFQLEDIETNSILNFKEAGNIFNQ